MPEYDDGIDWSQADATKDQVAEWMKNMAPFLEGPVALARAAHEHFRRPYHINVLVSMAEKFYAGV